MNDNGRQIYDQAQRYELERVEAKHDLLPDKPAILISVGLASAESGTVLFLMLAKTTLLTAFVNATLPLFFLCAIAYFYASKFELPEKYRQLIEEYDLTLITEEDYRKFKLIPDLDEYEDLFVDKYISWIGNLDRHNPISSEQMLRWQSDIEFFIQRSHELDREHFEQIKICDLEYKQKLKDLNDRSCPLPRSGQTDLQFSELSAKWFAAEQNKLKTEFEVDLKSINEEYKIIKQGCLQRIETAQKNYDDAIARSNWRESA
jgi:hypothetical protein